MGTKSSAISHRKTFLCLAGTVLLFQGPSALIGSFEAVGILFFFYLLLRMLGGPVFGIVDVLMNISIWLDDPRADEASTIECFFIFWVITALLTLVFGGAFWVKALFSGDLTLLDVAIGMGKLVLFGVVYTLFWRTRAEWT